MQHQKRDENMRMTKKDREAVIGLLLIAISMLVISIIFEYVS